jgi:hypothetical protein
MDGMDETDEIEILKKDAELTEDMSLTTERNATDNIQAVCNSTVHIQTHNTVYVLCTMCQIHNTVYINDTRNTH